MCLVLPKGVKNWQAYLSNSTFTETGEGEDCSKARLILRQQLDTGVGPTGALEWY